MKLTYQGWVCPKCNTVYAPWIEQCTKCKNTSIGYGYIVGTEKTHKIIKNLHEPREQEDKEE